MGRRGAAEVVWEEGGSLVVVGGLRLVSVYQPSWGADGDGMESCKRDMERQIAMGNKERIVIGAGGISMLA